MNYSIEQAHKLTQRAIRRGLLISQLCEVCGKKAVAHHDDYEKPLDVRWLCRKHHVAWHRQNGAGLNRDVDRDWFAVSKPLLLGDIISFGRVRYRVDQSITTIAGQKVRIVLA